MKRDSSFPSSCSAMNTSSLAKKEDRGYITARAISRTSIGSFRDDQCSCPSAVGIPLMNTKSTPAKIKYEIRDVFMTYHGRSFGAQGTNLDTCNFASEAGKREHYTEIRRKWLVKGM